MNIFNSLKTYGGNWQEVASRNFTAEELSEIKSAKVVSSQYGSSVCFTMVSGGMHYIPLSTKSSLNVGDSVNVASARLVTLHRDGSEDITRVEA